MKQFFKGLVTGVAGTVMLVGSLGYAQSLTQSIQVEFLPLRYIFDGQQKAPPPDQQGFIYNDRTYVPLRFVVESLGKTVKWDQTTYTISVGAPATPESTQPTAPSTPAVTSSERRYLVFVLPDGKRYLVADQRDSIFYSDGQSLYPAVRDVSYLLSVLNGAYKVAGTTLPSVSGELETSSRYLTIDRTYIDPSRIDSRESYVYSLNNPLTGKNVQYDPKGTQWQQADVYTTCPFSMDEWFSKLGITARYEFDKTTSTLVFHITK